MTSNSQVSTTGLSWVRRACVFARPRAYLRVSANQTLRDGFFGHWLRAVRDGVAGWRRMRRTRRRWTERTERLCREIDRRRPGVAYKLKRRLPRRGVQI